MKRATSIIVCYLLLLPVPATWAQSKSPSPLTIENIMRGPELYGYAPSQVRWSGDSSRVYFRWKKHDEPRTKDASAYVVNRDGSGLRRLTEEEEKESPPTNGEESKDHKLTLYSTEGDLFLYDRVAGRRVRLTKTTEAETNPRFTKDESRITLQRSNNLYLLNMRTGMLEQLTEFRSAAAATAPAAPAGPPLFTGGRGTRGGGPPRSGGGSGASTDAKGTDSQEFLKKEERELLAIVKERAEKREEDEAKRKKEPSRKPFTLTAQQSITGMQLSPDETFVAAGVQDSAERAKSTIVPNFITDGGYTADIPSRSKVGDDQSRTRIAMVDVKSGDVKWVQHGIKDKDKDRDVRLSRPMFSDDGKLIVAGRAADNKDTWIFAVDPKTGQCRAISHEHDDAWVGGPASFTMGWLKDNESVYFVSERSGWAHLYTVPFRGGEPKQLTSGSWEVRNVELSKDGAHFLLSTSEVNAGEDHLYKMSVSGGDRKKLTTLPGRNEAVLSPDGSAAAVVNSYTNKPHSLFIQNLRDGKLTTVVSAASPEFAGYGFEDTPVVKIPARDGAMVPAHLYKPKNWRRGGPLVIFVHGAGYTQNVHKGWSSYAREYMFHHLLMERGFLVLALDYRASAGYGRDWRTAIYRFMGGADLNDQVDAVKWAVTEYGVDPNRVGLYGGSYGGFITLMALFTQPDVFQAGASLRPVTDWAHYNHQYTSNILNVPQIDAEAYRKSSPIYHAQGLKGTLLICHGMVDTNVHFQDTARLVQRLIELKKDNWELAVYPVEDHGFVQTSSWIDEYKRILKLFETTLKKRT